MRDQPTSELTQGVTAHSQQRFVRAKKENPWVEWVCPYCNAEVSDPASIKETSCGNGHIVYLGKVSESRYGYSRRAYKTRAERIHEQRKEKIMHETYMQIMHGAFSPND
jgi:hypothetical protein